MTNKENALAALRGEKHDSIPCFFSSMQIITASELGDVPPMFQGPDYDKYGVHQTPTDSAGGMATPTPTIPPVLTDITKWQEQVTLPDYDSIDWKAEAVRDCAIFNTDREHFGQDFFCANGIFERLHFLMGFEGALCAIVEEPEAVSEFVGVLADLKIKAVQIAARYYKPDVFTYLDDYSHQNGLFISPADFRKIFKPHLQRIFDAIKQTGMIPKFHCCGKMQDLTDDFMEIGVKACDPCMPMNDIIKMQKKHPDICFMGGLDIQHVIDAPGITEDEIRTEVRRCIDTYGPAGNYMMYGTSLSLYNPSAYAPGESIGTVIDECARYGTGYYL